MSKAKKEIVDWKAALAAQAQEIKKNAGGGAFISLKGGRMSYEDKYLDDGIQCVIIGHTFLRSYYEGAYQAGSVVPPNCFSIAQDRRHMVPHENVPSPVNDVCASCPNAEFPKGGGAPLCKTRVRLAVAPVSDGTSADAIKSAQVAHVTLPPTSIKPWVDYVTALAEQGLAPWAVKTLFKFEGSPSKPWGMASFEAVAPLGGDAVMAAAFSRLDEGEALIVKPYTYDYKEGVDTSRYS